MAGKKSGSALYAQALRALTYGLWNGTYPIGDFVAGMTDAVVFYLAKAFYEGAALMGVQKDELTDKEINLLTVRIFQQLPYINNLAAYVEKHSKANKGKLAVAQSRIPMWVNTYNLFVQLGMLSARADPKLRWNLGAAEHCASCLKLAGKVKRKSIWLAHDLYPKHRALACGGYNCQCYFTPTDEPASKGKLPGIP